MVIIGSKEGQFANRLLHFTHIVSSCRSEEIKVVHPYFEDFLPFFSKLGEARNISIIKGQGFSRYLFKAFFLFIKVLIKLKLYNLGFLEVIYYDRYDQGAPVIDLSEKRLKRKAKNKILVLYGWLFRDEQDYEKNRAFVKELFSIEDKYVAEAKKQIGQFMSDSKILVGVHVRRGDYKRFENGRWFYEDAVYMDKMRSLQEQLTAQGQKVGFVICSNEDLNLANFEGFQVYHTKNHFIIDFLLLTKSDYIIGPPSTFSGLASYWGQVPLQFLYSSQEVIHLNQFNVCRKV